MKSVKTLNDKEILEFDKFDLIDQLIAGEERYLTLQAEVFKLRTILNQNETRSLREAGKRLEFSKKKRQAERESFKESIVKKYHLEDSHFGYNPDTGEIIASKQ